MGGILYLIEFSYNNGYHASLNMTPFESLYGKKCNTPVSWNNSISKVIMGPNLLKDMKEHMRRINQN